MDSYFEKGVRLHGTLWVKGYVHFDGYFEGEIYSTNDFVVGKAGKVLGNIKTYNVTNKGNIQGNLFAENKVTLADGSRLAGDISTYSLIVDEGSNFEGRCKMIDVPPKSIKEEIQCLDRPLPAKNIKTSKVFKTPSFRQIWKYTINKICIATAIFVISGGTLFIPKEKQNDLGTFVKKGSQIGDITRIIFDD